jgi:hypothetical protein
MRSHIGGPLVLTKYITFMKDYVKTALLAEQAYQEFLAYILF